jgi:hypothetical protein
MMTERILHVLKTKHTLKNLLLIFQLFFNNKIILPLRKKYHHALEWCKKNLIIPHHSGE